jgi:hypothetical protein
MNNIVLSSFVAGCVEIRKYNDGSELRLIAKTYITRQITDFQTMIRKIELLASKVKTGPDLVSVSA